MFFVEDTIQGLIKEFENIPPARKSILREIASYVENARSASLVFICTHNSRRSHMAQIWAQAAASYFNIANVRSYSGGTEATAFNPRAVDAMRKLGFVVQQTTSDANPRYTIRYSDDHPAFEVFSKRYDASENPSIGFAAIMTCTHADENCPVVTGATARISLPFDDPKDFDGTSTEAPKYLERAWEIGREILYAFSQIEKR